MKYQLDSEFVQDLDLKEAGDGRRLLHHCIDQIVVFFMIRELTFFLAENTSLVDWVLRHLNTTMIFIVSCVFALSINWIYYFGQENFMGGKTIGKLITKCCVLGLEVQQPGTRAIAIRSLARLIPFEALTIFTGTILHDRLSKTTVITL